ncbi:hypothetical protein GN958_ATG09084 [Phytophthora infestans]|uniref:Uncharacterized protein n=1 Tax=Phytophthora infestans TaxID=4787 RepID=A0A8S9URS5_PHYIN|nr:hypothetical protein GN958_ATG09084 [Phytophthora infestans]
MAQPIPSRLHTVQGNALGHDERTIHVSTGPSALGDEADVAHNFFAGITAVEGAGLDVSRSEHHEALAGYLGISYP